MSRNDRRTVLVRCEQPHGTTGTLLAFRMPLAQLGREPASCRALDLILWDLLPSTLRLRIEGSFMDPARGLIDLSDHQSRIIWTGD
jgi:hypothetical protein